MRQPLLQVQRDRDVFDKATPVDCSIPIFLENE